MEKEKRKSTRPVGEEKPQLNKGKSKERSKREVDNRVVYKPPVPFPSIMKEDSERTLYNKFLKIFESIRY